MVIQNENSGHAEVVIAQPKRLRGYGPGRPLEPGPLRL